MLLFPARHFWKARRNHVALIKVSESAESHKERVAHVAAYTARTTPVKMLVQNAGLSLPTTDGMRAIIKIHVPTENTISCQGILPLNGFASKRADVADCRRDTV